MDIEAYSKLAIRTAPVESESLSGIVHAALGIGEIPDGARRLSQCAYKRTDGISKRANERSIRAHGCFDFLSKYVACLINHRRENE